MHITLDPVTLPFDPQIRMTGGPRFSNTAFEDGNRDPQSNIQWDSAKWEWTLQFIGEGPLMQMMTGFFLARAATAYAWWFIDPMDSTARVADGTGWVKLASDGKWYLTKVYPDTDNYRPYQRRIRCPIAGTVNISALIGATSVNPQTGEVVGARFEGPCDFNFRCPVRFASDIAEMVREPGDAGSMWQVLVQEVGKFVVAS